MAKLVDVKQAAMEQGAVTETELDSLLERGEIANETGLELDPEEVRRAILNSPEVQVLEEWALQMRGLDAAASTMDSEGWSTPRGSATRRRKGLMDRDRYVASSKVNEQFRIARRATEEDDTVSAVVDSTEGMAFSKMTMECLDKDQEDIWNQIAADLDLDSRLREMWRERFICSQFVVGVWWGEKTYTVRGKSDKGIKRKRPVSVTVPRAFNIFDPLKVFPVGNLMFNQERLVYVADATEDPFIDRVMRGRENDETITNFMKGRYKLNDHDVKQLRDAGWDRGAPDRCWLMDETKVFRYTDTRAQFQPFAPVRMKSVFGLLDMKAQLQQMDRAFLVGGTNFIILVKKGAPNEPASQRELAALQGYVRTMAQIPILVGDHRLNVEIVAPDTSNILKPERYNALDARIEANCYRMFMTGNYAAGTKGDDSLKLARVVARGLESLRHQIKRSIEKNVWKRVLDLNPDFFDEMPDLRFQPKHIALEFDINMANFYLELRQMRVISRETFLSEFDIDQDVEAERLEYEKDHYDDVFEEHTPFDSPMNLPKGQQPGQPVDPNAPAAAAGAVKKAAKKAEAPAAKKAASNSGGKVVDKRAAGRRGGGLKNGGGSAPGTGQGIRKS